MKTSKPRYSDTRRKLVTGLGAAALWPMIQVPRIAEAKTLTLTPAQTEGPYYPLEFPADIDNDLVQFADRQAQALGHLLHIRGQVMDADGQLIDRATVEIWHCDQFGYYHHSRDRKREKIDENFQGFGRDETDSSGNYQFRTVAPGRYPGRTPHVHFKIKAPGFDTLITQMYDGSEQSGNQRDGVYRRIRNDAQKAAVTVAYQPADKIESGALLANFNIVLG